jgi:hypothetical protein
MQAKNAFIRLPRSLFASIAARNRRACSALMTTRGSTVVRVRGFVHFTALNGLAARTPVSQAYSIALPSTIRLRFAVFAAAGLPFLAWLIRASIARACAAPAVRSVRAAS